MLYLCIVQREHGHCTKILCSLMLAITPSKKELNFALVLYVGLCRMDFGEVSMVADSLSLPPSGIRCVILGGVVW